MSSLLESRDKKQTPKQKDSLFKTLAKKGFLGSRAKVAATTKRDRDK